MWKKGSDTYDESLIFPRQWESPKRSKCFDTLPLISQTGFWENWEGVCSISMSIEQTLQSLTVCGVKIPKPADVRAYLFQYSDMAVLLEVICLEAIQQLGNRAQLSLEIYHDLEIEDEYLTLCARQEKYDEDLLEQLDTISDKYEKFLINISGWLLLTTDFQPPN